MHQQQRIEDLYRELNPQILRIIGRQFNAPYMRESVEDAVAEAWTILDRKLTQNPDYLQHEGAKPWLVTVAQHELYRLTRIRRRSLTPYDSQPVLEELLTELTTEEEAFERMEARELLEVLRDGDMAVGRRQALMTRAIGLTYKQAMQATGRSYTSINSGITKGRAQLRGASTPGLFR